MTRVLYLGPPSPLLEWLQQREELVIQTEQPLHPEGPAAVADWLVSYNYRHRVHPAVLHRFGDRTVNLHTSYLPHNRGAHPNLWAWLEDTPHGVSLHRMDAGLDTGPLYARWLMPWVPHELPESVEGLTLRSTYAVLQSELQLLFRRYWPALERAGGEAMPQPPGGSFHTTRDYERVKHLLTQGWDTPVLQIKGKGRTE